MIVLGVPLPATLAAARHQPEGRHRRAPPPRHQLAAGASAAAGDAASEPTLPQRRQRSDSAIGGGGATSAKAITAARQLQEPERAQQAEAAKQLNRLLCGAPSASALLQLVSQGLHQFNDVNAITAFHRLAKHAARLAPAQRDALRAHPTCRQLATWLEGAGVARRASDVHVGQLLWAAAQAQHGSPALVDALLYRLSTAVVVVAPTRGNSGGSSSSASSVPPPPLQLHNMGAAVMLCYAQARLQRPQRALLQRLATALLQEEAETERGQERKGGSRTGNICSGPGPGPGAADANSATGAGISLAACSCRDLCLLMWALASMGACPPALLRAATRTLRRRGVTGLSVQSMTNILTAQQAALTSSSSSSSGIGLAGGSVEGDTSGGGGGAWDLALVDTLGAELALRWRQQQREQQREEGGNVLLLGLNPLDCCLLTRCFALAWRQAAEAEERRAAAATGGGGSSPPASRLAAARSVQRFIAAAPQGRDAPRRLLAATAFRLAPQLDQQAVSSLAHSFALMGGVPHPLLEALAARATQLQDSLDIQAVVSLTWAYSALAFDHPPLFDALAAATLRLLGPAAPDTPPHLTGGGSCSGSGDASGGGGSEAGGQRGDFGAQAVSVVAFGLASANRCSGTAVQRRAMAALAARAAEVLPHFTTQGLANLAWALAVAACYPPELLRRWRTLAGAAASRFRPVELTQLHLVEVALRVEAPGIGLDTPAEAAAFFDALYQAGRLRAFARRGWQASLEGGPRTVSSFQKQVHRTLCDLGLGGACRVEHSEAGGYSVDVALLLPGGCRVAVEADGPVHFCSNSAHLLGGTALKRRLLQRLGWRPVAVPFYEWQGLESGVQRRRYLQHKLEEATGLSLPLLLLPRVDEAEDGGVGELMVEAVAATAVQKGKQQGAGAATPPLQREHSATPSVEEAQPSGSGDDAAAGDASAHTSAAEAAVAAATSHLQRAQRLALLQYRSRKGSGSGLSKHATMLAKGSARQAAAAAKAAAASAASDAAAAAEGKGLGTPPTPS